MTNLKTNFLTDLFQKSTRAISERRIGLEIERIAIWKDSAPFCYQEKNNKKGAKGLLEALRKAYHWKTVSSASGDLIGLETDQGKISLEPGSQLEFAVYPQSSLQTVAAHLAQYDRQIDEVISDWKGLCFIGLGTNPIHSLEQLDVIPAPRYQIMTRVLGESGKWGTSMMRRTSSVQINLDYTSEEEAISMLRTSLLLAPLSTALFANSPFLEGQPTGFLSMRSEIWRHTDNRRTGLMPEAFESGFDFESYSRLLWKLPLMFVQSDSGGIVDAQGFNLEEISEGNLPGVSASEINQRSAIQQLFTEARLKPGYVEVRSVDGQLPPYRLAAAAFWMGILYSKTARDQALKLFGNFSPSDLTSLWIQASREGLKAEFKGLKLKKAALALLEASRSTLEERGLGEEEYLLPLEENAEAGLCPAEKVLDKFQTRWGGDLIEMLRHCRLTIEKEVGET